MDQEIPSDVWQEGETKADQNEKLPFESEEQPEDPATEVQTAESENQTNGNEMQSPDTEFQLPLESMSEVLEDESAPNAEFMPVTESAPDTEPVWNTEFVSNTEPVSNTETFSNAESVPDSELAPNAESLPNSEYMPNTESFSDMEPVTSVEPLLDSEYALAAESDLNTESVQNEESEPQNTESQQSDLPTSQTPKDKVGTSGRNQKRGFKSPKAGTCDKYGWPIGSKYCTEVQESTSPETSFAEDIDTVGGESEGNEKEDVAQEANQQEEEILFTVTSPVHKRVNTKRTIIKVEEVEGAITDGIHAGTHLPHFLTYLSWKIKFRLTLARLPDRKLKITIRFGGKGGETLKNIICLWLRREDEDKDKIICEGLSRNKEEILILLAKKFHEMEHLKEDPIALYEEVKQLVPELRGKEGLRSEDEAFLSAYRDLDEKLRILMMLLYREGCGWEGKNQKTLSQFRDMYFSLQLKPGFTVKQYLWAFYYYNLVFSPCLPRDLEQMMQKYATLKNVVLPDTPALIFPPGGQTITSTVINPFAKKNLQSPKQGNLPKENSYAEYEMVPVNSDGFVLPATEQFKKPTNAKQRYAQRRRQANQRNRKISDAASNQNLTNQKNSSNQGTNARKQINQVRYQQRKNFSNQRNNLPNQRSPQNPRNPRNQSVQRNPPNLGNLPNLRSPANQRNSLNQRNVANKRRQGNQGGSVNKRRPANRGGPANLGSPANLGGLPNEGGSPNPGVSINQGISAIQGNLVTQGNQPNQIKPTGRRNQQNQRKPPGQRNKQPNQRNKPSNQRNNQPNQRNNQPNQRNNQPRQRNNQRRNSRSRRRSDFRKHGPNTEQNFSDTSRNQGFSSSSDRDFILNSLRNQDFMQRNQDFGRNQSFTNQRNQSFPQSSSRNQSFSQGNHSRNSSFSQSSNPRSLFSQQEFFDQPRSQNYSQSSSLGQSFSQQSSRRLPVWSADFFGSSQDFFSGPSNFSSRSSSVNRTMRDMQIPSFNSRRSFNDEINAQNFSNSAPNNWDNKSNRGKRKNMRDNWHSKRPKQGT